MATAAAAAAAMPTPEAPWSSVTLKMERRSEEPPGPPSAAGERGSARYMHAEVCLVHGVVQG